MKKQHNALSLSACSSCSSLVLLVAAAAFTPSAATAQQCSGAQSFSGDYMMVVSRLVYQPQAVMPPGTTAPAAPQTAAVRIVDAAKLATPASAGGRIYADGAGGLLEIAGGAATPFGSYSVGGDCSLTINVQKEGKTGATFRGFVQDRGSSAALIEASGLEMDLTRPFLAGGCSVSTLSGPVVLDGFGFTAAAAAAMGAAGEAGGGGTPAPFWILERVFADGAGAFQVDALAGAAAPYTGTYTLGADCTGTASIKSGDGKTIRSMQILMTQAAGATGAVGRPALRFVITGTGNAGAGNGK